MYEKLGENVESVFRISLVRVYVYVYGACCLCPSEQRTGRTLLLFVRVFVAFFLVIFNAFQYYTRVKTVSDDMHTYNTIRMNRTRALAWSVRGNAEAIVFEMES